MAEEQLSLLEKIRQVPWIKETREKHQKALKNYREKKFNEPAVLEEEYVKKIDFLQ